MSTSRSNLHSGGAGSDEEGVERRKRAHDDADGGGEPDEDGQQRKKHRKSHKKSHKEEKRHKHGHKPGKAKQKHKVHPPDFRLRVSAIDKLSQLGINKRPAGPLHGLQAGGSVISGKTRIDKRPVEQHIA